MSDRHYNVLGLTVEATKLPYAKNKALKIIQTNKTISTAPTLIAFRGALAIVYPVLDWESPKESWSYQLLWAATVTEKNGLIMTGAVIGFASHTEACHAARRHLAQTQWNGTTEDPGIFQFVEGCADALQRYALEMTTIKAPFAKPAPTLEQKLALPVAHSLDTTKPDWDIYMQ